MRQVIVRWWDGYLEVFDVADWRAGSDLLWLRLSDGHVRHIPLRQVRWFEPTPNEMRKQLCKARIEDLGQTHG